MCDCGGCAAAGADSDDGRVRQLRDPEVLRAWVHQPEAAAGQPTPRPRACALPPGERVEKMHANARYVMFK